MAKPGMVKKRHAKGSKNRKRAVWRKDSNVADVEEFMDEQREDARLGLGEGVHAKQDAELFIVDDLLAPPADRSQPVKEETPDVPLGSSTISPFNKPQVPSKLRLPEEALWKKLKCFKSLPGGRAPEPTRPHARRTAEANSVKLQRLHELATRKKTRKVATGPKTAGRPRFGRDPLFNRDLWNDAVSATDEPVETRTPAISCPKRPPMTLQARVKSDLGAVEVPHPGISYNPAPTDHQNLLSMASERAQAKQREEDKLREFSKKRLAAGKSAAESWMEEMQQGLPDALEPAAPAETAVDDGQVEEEAEFPRKVAGDGRKTKKDRRKQKMLAQQKTQRLKVKEKKMMEHQVFSVKKLVKSLEAKAKEDAAQLVLRKARRDDPQRLRKLSKYKFEEQDPDVKLPEDMTDNLRTLRPEGSLLMDRYKSLQRRNIVEPRRRQKIKRKYKLKAYQIEGRTLEELKK